MLSYVNKPTGAFIDYLSCVYRDCNAVTIGELNDMLSYVNKRKNECNKLSFYLSHIK